MQYTTTAEEEKQIKRMIKKIISLLCFIVIMQTAFAQSFSIDSMLQKIAAEKDDNKRIDIIYHSLVLIGETDPLLGLKYAQGLLIYAGKNDDKIAEAYSTSYSAKMYGIIGNVEA